MVDVASQQIKPLAASTRRRMSFEEFLAWDGDGNPELHAEWVDGEAVPMVSINSRHSMISAFLVTLLGLACSAKNVGILLTDPFVMRPGKTSNGRSPDVIIVSHEHKDRIKDNFLDGPADVAVEIVSPGSIKTDYIVKAAEYRRNGVPEYWIIDPIEQQTTFFLLNSEGEYYEPAYNEEGLYSSIGLNGLAIDPSWFHQEPLPDVLAILRQWGVFPTA